MGRIRSKTGRKSGQKRVDNRVGKSMVSDGSEMTSKKWVRKSGCPNHSKYGSKKRVRNELGSGRNRVGNGSESGRKRGVARKTSKFGLNCKGKSS